MVAGPGEDATVLVIVDGSKVIDLRAWTKPDARGEVASTLAPYRERLETVNVDSAGICHYFDKRLEDRTDTTSDDFKIAQRQARK